VAGWRDGDICAVIENLVYLELARRGYKVSVGKIDDLEIDFIAERDGGSIYIQVAYLPDSPATIVRELAPFRKLSDRSPSRLITLDRVQGRDFEGVRRLDLRDFLRGAEL
jgi:predicted AAA+ superfamily ATPase